MLKNNPVPVWIPVSPSTRKGSLFVDRYMFENRSKCGRFKNVTFASRRLGGTREGKFFQVFPLSVLLIRVLTSHEYSVYSVAWSPDGKQIASGSQDETIKIWDSQSGDCQSTLTGHRYALTGHRYVTTPPPLPVTTVLSPTVLILQEQCPHTGYLLCHLVVTVVNVQLTK